MGLSTTMPLNVYYDTRYNPVTFDFSYFLVNADVYRQSTPATSISLHIVAADYRIASLRDQAYEISEKRWRVQHIIGQVPRLLPTVVNISFHYDLPKNVVSPSFPPNYPENYAEGLSSYYYPKYFLHGYDQGAKVQPFKASEHAKHLVRNFTRGHEYITVSLRTSRFQTARNSNLTAWYKFSQAVKASGRRVLVIPDFEDVFHERLAWKYDWDIVDFASHDLDLRLALYEDAEDNFVINNGVASLLWFSNCPFKMFKLVTPQIWATSKKYLKTSWEIEPGNTPRIFGEHQKWLWDDDSVENLMPFVDQM